MYTPILGVAHLTMAHRYEDVPPPLPPRTQDMVQGFCTMPRTSNVHDDQLSTPPPLPPRPGSSTSRRMLSAGNIGPRPPPLPLRSTQSLPRSNSTPHTSARQEYDSIAQSLSELTKGFTVKIPSCVTVREYSSVHNTPTTIAVGDTLLLHFSKATRVVHMLSISNMKLIVPVNSPMLCSVLFDPVDDIDRAQKGYIFGSGSQLIGASTLPQFVGVEKGCTKTKYSSEFTSGEILVVKCLCKNGSLLECRTIPDGDKRYVHSSTTAVFTTNPDRIKVHLSEVVKHLEYQVKLKFYPQNVELVQHMRKPYTLLHVDSQKSVIATYGNPKQISQPYVLEIFENAPLKCDFTNPTQPAERAEVIRKSKKLFESFTPSCVSEIIVDISLAVMECQTLLFLSVEQVHGTLTRTTPMVHNASITGARTGHVPFASSNNTLNPIDTRYIFQSPGSNNSLPARNTLHHSANPTSLPHQQSNSPLLTEFPAIEVSG